MATLTTRRNLVVRRIATLVNVDNLPNSASKGKTRESGAKTWLGIIFFPLSTCMHTRSMTAVNCEPKMYTDYPHSFMYKISDISGAHALKGYTKCIKEESKEHTHRLWQHWSLSHLENKKKTGRLTESFVISFQCQLIWLHPQTFNTEHKQWRLWQVKNLVSSDTTLKCLRNRHF